jgi:hypothetical protein
MRQPEVCIWFRPHGLLAILHYGIPLFTAKVSYRKAKSGGHTLETVARGTVRSRVSLVWDDLRPVDSGRG